MARWSVSHRLAALALLASVTNFADGAPSELQRNWLQISEREYPASQSVQVRELRTEDPDQLLATELAGQVLLGKTLQNAKQVKEWQLRKHGEHVGATLVVYWRERDVAKAVVAGQSQRSLTTNSYEAVLSRGPDRGPFSEGRMSVTIGRIHALYLRDCQAAPCEQIDPRPELSTVQNCVLPRCARVPDWREVRFIRLDRQTFPATPEVSIEAVDGARVNELVGAIADVRVLGKSVVPWSGPAGPALEAQARRVGADRVLWWVERNEEEHAVYLRDCGVQSCVAEAR